MPISKILIYISIIFSIIYLINIIKFIIGLIKKTNIPDNSNLISISIIIAVKNGEDSIKRMLDNLSKQTYRGNMEFIIIDDKSTDNTKRIINDYLLIDPRFKYVSSELGSPCLNHKKRAIDAGIQQSQYEYLLFSDIDCIVQFKWVESMAKCFTEDIDYVVGHAYVDSRKSILNKFQRVDLFMLLFAAKSRISLNSAWASIGQNQAYTKTLYNKLNGFTNIASYLQGDDTLFLQLAVKNGANIIFNDRVESHVISRAEKKWKDLLWQRGRWSGDANIMWKFNLPFYFAAVATWIISISMIMLMLFNYLNIFLSIVVCKMIFEIIFYRLGMKKVQQPIQYIDFMIWFIIHPIYVSIMGLLSFFNFSWKGTAIK